jgi:hypothetical protein
MTQMINGFWVTQVVYALATFSIADHLAKGSACANAVADAAGLPRSATARLLRACVSLGLVTFADGRFAATPLLDTLRTDNPQSLRDVALTIPSEHHWLPWGRFVTAMRTEEPQPPLLFGKSIFERLADFPEDSATFTRAMVQALRFETAEAVRVIDPAPATVIADIGGAGGSLLHAVLQANPGPRGIVFDLPTIVANAEAASVAAGLEDRVTAIGGNFFDAVPAADLYLLRLVLHDWDNASCVRILSNCRRSMTAGGRVMVIEKVLGDIAGAGSEAMMDLNMMVMLGGRERTEEEFRALFTQAGLVVTKVIATDAPGTAVIEAVAA